MTASTTPAIRSRKPTGEVPLPFVLIEGEAKSGRTWAAIRLSASPKVGRTFLLDLIDGIGDEYALIPGADYEILVPAADEWTHADILEQILAVKAEAVRARKVGEPPVVLVIDTMTALWNSLKDWTTERAKGSATNKAKLARDPNADITVPRHLWNATDKRYQQIIGALKTFPGIVVATANGREVSATGPDGQPVEGKKSYSVQAEKDVVGDATVTIRMRRTAPPEVVAARSAVNGLQPGKDEPKPINAPEAIGPDGNLLEWLIFTALGCDPATRHVRDVRAVTAGGLTPEERGSDPRAEGFRDWALQLGHTHASLGALYEEVRQAGLINAVVVDDHGDDVTLHDLINRLGRELPEPPQGTPSTAHPPTAHPNGATRTPSRPPQHGQVTRDWFALMRSQIDGAVTSAALDNLSAIADEGCTQHRCPEVLPEMQAHIGRRRATLAAPADRETLRTMHIALTNAKVKSDDDHKRAASRLVGRPQVVASTEELNYAEAIAVTEAARNAPRGVDLVTGQTVSDVPPVQPTPAEASR